MRAKLAQHTRAAVPEGAPSLRPLLAIAAALECLFLWLMAVAPAGGVAQSISPLARAWPILLAPARLVFGDALVNGSLPPARGWPALALFAVLLVAASCVAALVIPVTRGGLIARRRAPDAHESGVAGWWRRTTDDQRRLALALGVTAVLGLTLVLLPSLPSDDVFSYILYGRISVVHHANPLVTAPSAFPHDPFLTLVFWQGTRAVYGPAWLLLSAAVTGLAEALGGALATYVLLFKLVGLAAHLANAALIWAILGRIAPDRRLLGTLLYAWNPLCLLEFCASAHNDAVMLTGALLGVYWLTRGWEVAALVAFGLSISIKYVWLALLPLYFLLVVRARLRQSAAAGAIARALAWRAGVVAGVVALTALPYWAGPATLSGIVYSPPAQQLDNSLLEALSWPLRALAQGLGLAPAAAKSAVEALLKLGALALFAWLWLRAARRVRDLPGLLNSWAWVLVAYVVIASGWFWPWYVTWPVALVALLPVGELTIAVLLLAGGVLTLYAFLPLYAAPVYGLRAWLAFGPAVAYLLYQRRALLRAWLRLPRVRAR
jgi:hypothetical protein